MADSYANGPAREVEFVKATRMSTPQEDPCIQVEIGNLARELTLDTALKLAAAIRREASHRDRIVEATAASRREYLGMELENLAAERGVEPEALLATLADTQGGI
jgi:hypothetical protein